jgi:hypothetical protein
MTTATDVLEPLHKLSAWVIALIRIRIAGKVHKIQKGLRWGQDGRNV